LLPICFRFLDRSAEPVSKSLFFIVGAAGIEPATPAV
jgi:hypothetical protein